MFYYIKIAGLIDRLCRGGGGSGMRDIISADFETKARSCSKKGQCEFSSGITTLK